MASRLNLVFLWHMHQPDYRDTDGEFMLPWVLLHMLKDYTDMAAHLERHPEIRCVINFVPSLLEQIEDYREQLRAKSYRDPLLRLLATDTLGHITAAERSYLLEACFNCNPSTMIDPFPGFKRLHSIKKCLEHTSTTDPDHEAHAHPPKASCDYLGAGYYADLITWYFLAWSGETERQRAPILNTLMQKGHSFDHADRMALLNWIGETVQNLIPRYRALAERGQIELSSTPQTHPIAPLLLDYATMREAMPEAPLPEAASYPDGAERLDEHIRLAQDSHEQRFGSVPVGMWPAEGALCTDSVRAFSRAGVHWLASGEGVLLNSLSAAREGQVLSEHAVFYPWRLQGTDTLLFFRNETLSDQIGFEYAKWYGEDAAQDFCDRLDQILSGWPHETPPLVGVMLDGENAWEYFPYNGWHFFENLYTTLASNQKIQTTTFATLTQQYAGAQAPTEIIELPRLIAGSWVHGTLSTWIGEPAKNHAWDLLTAAKQAFDENVDTLKPDDRELAEAQLLKCESSDWFWWFGDYHPAISVGSFDRLFRTNLKSLYELLGQTPPPELDRPICVGDQAATRIGTMQPAKLDESVD